MLALIACVLSALAAFGVQAADVHLGWLGAAFLCAHFVLGEWSPWRR